MRSGEVGDVDDVDSTDDENSTVVTVNIPRSGDGMYIVHLMPMRGDDRFRVELQREKDLAVIGSSTGRPEWGSGTQAAAPAQTPGPRLSTPAVETAESPGEETPMIAEMIPESFSHVVLVTGSRSWNEAKSMPETFDDAGRGWGPKNVTRPVLLSGHCPKGADTRAEPMWRDAGSEIVIFPADWSAREQADSSGTRR
ncbi:hypothetical protein ACFVGY_26760 [Streptomyces sp. NPDC127106]|uniref:hypothetical protein n=1 Tax=Streptomyces sp. NPDC127106 TaxID=3345360 RepID=UPI00362693B6